jgi:hypothetical protein
MPTNTDDYKIGMPLKFTGNRNTLLTTNKYKKGILKRIPFCSERMVISVK